jgi:hypothetical protein
MDLRGLGWEDVELIYPAQDRDQWQVHSNEPSCSMKNGLIS